MHPTTAILLFSRSAQAESRIKSYGQKNEYGDCIAESLINRTRRTLKATEFPVFQFDEAQQRGITFGERLANAMDDLFVRGYDRLIVVGNDCPSLTVVALHTAGRMLDLGQNVVGGDARGGAWLIGIHREAFDRLRFAELPWQTSSLLSELSSYLKQIYLLRQLRDVNCLSDLREHWRYFAGLLPNIAHLFIPNPAITTWITGCKVSAHKKAPAGRAPPQAA